MSKLKKVIISLLLIILTFCYGKGELVAPAEAKTINFSWQGDKGYVAKGYFNYDEKLAPEIITEKGIGKSQVLDTLKITFYNPSGKTIETYDDVKDGNIQTHYLQLKFDPKTKKFQGKIDLGGELIGDLYLKGIVEQDLSLIKVESSGIEYTLDRNLGKLNTSFSFIY